MQRRSFLKDTIISSAGILFIPHFSKAGWLTEGTENVSTLQDLEKNFITPPDHARPWVFYMWMNGNITEDGITADLEAMKRMGIGGFINFNSAVGIPRGPVDYAGKVWSDAVAHTASEATRLGLQMFMHNSPGYSGCGGPWVTPELSMQQLVWTETLINSTGTKINTKLAMPYGKHGYYRDACTIAYPSLPVEKALMKDKLIRAKINGKEIDRHIITDGNPETKIRIEVISNNKTSDQEAIYDFSDAPTVKQISDHAGGRNKSMLLLEFSEPFEARAISIYRKPETPKDLFDGPRDHPPVLLLESSPDGLHFETIGRIACIELRAMDTPSTLSFAAVRAKFYRLTTTTSTWISGVELYNGPRLGGWAGKTSQTHGNSIGQTPEVEPQLIIEPETVTDISGWLDKDGNLNWEAPAGNWTILRIGHTTTGEEPAAHPDAAKGLETDKFNRDALDLHFDKFLDPLLQKLKPDIGKGMKGITVDSWEAGKSNWTIKFPEAFKKISGYDIMQWMPAMTGRITGSIEDTERFLWDVRKTHADLLAENFYAYFQQSCHKRGLEFNAEPYGDGVFDSVQVGQYLDTPMSEFWTRYIYGSDVTSKQAASIAHVYGRPVVAAEAFTAMPANSKWTDYPYSLKAEGDYFFTLGVNRLVFHTFVHQPYKTGKPGMTMGPFGAHMDRNNSWAEQAYGWTGYLKRTQYLLQQGLFVADACYFKGDEAESGIPDTYEFMPPGHAADVIGADGLNRFTIKNNQITLPDGMRYHCCILAKLENILPQTLNRLKELVNEGMILIVSNRPEKTCGRQQNDQFIKEAVAELYGNLDGSSVKKQIYGKGKIIWTEDLHQVFDRLAIGPDFNYTAQNPDATIHYLHKKLDGMEYYFVSNHRRRYEKVVCSFRITGMQPEIWNSETLEMYEQVIYTFKDGYTTISLELEPAGALFVVFRKKTNSPGYAAILKEKQPYLNLEPWPSSINGAYPDVKNNFSVTLWAKPDVYAQDTRSMLFHPPQGEIIYGKGHVAMALGAGQNGVRVYERAAGKMRIVLSAAQALQGWTHIAVVYENGRPSLYINGKLTARGKSSGNIVHPGLKTRAEQSQFSTYFEGNCTEPQLFEEILTGERITRSYHAGLPAPSRPVDIELKQSPKGKLEALVYKNGSYIIQGSGNRKHLNINSCKSIDLSNTWVVNFPEQPELPEAVRLPELISLHHHQDFNVRHFSGTAVYTRSFNVTTTDLRPDRRMWLDLGRVEVIAEVILNDTMLGNLWKAPYRVEVTKMLKPGNNHLEVKVTTLWPNRLIGDEYLPEENKYSIPGFIEKLPEWYIQNKPKPGERKAFSVWKNFKKTDPLLESGLLGPVKLITAVQKFIN